MQLLFQYNWQVRNEWFTLLGSLEPSELNRQRSGGFGSFPKTLFHLCVVEHQWICELLGKPFNIYTPEDYTALPLIKKLSDKTSAEAAIFLERWDPDMENRTLTLKGRDNQYHTFGWGEVLRHLVAHEIHHIGQMSVWAREANLKPVNANFIGRKLR